MGWLPWEVCKRTTSHDSTSNYGGLLNIDAANILHSTRYATSLLITEFNKPVCLYSLLRAQAYAKISRQQLIWIQAEDQPPHEHFAEYSAEQLQLLKEKWLKPTYHARKTDGILSLMPCVYDMPCKITSGKGNHCKEYGLHNGSRCRLKAIAFSAEDIARVDDNNESEIVLQKLPEALWVQSEQPLKKQVPGAPQDWFPLTPINNVWSLDKDECIEITRRGFALVPDFASTIHSATGRTLQSAICDFGAFDEKPSDAAAMRGYIGMSRVTDAEGLLIARPLPWKLFSQDAHPFPQLLLKVLQEDMTIGEIMLECERIAQQCKEDRKKDSKLWLRNLGLPAKSHDRATAGSRFL